jgi:hypothetical protein
VMWSRALLWPSKTGLSEAGGPWRLRYGLPWSQHYGSRIDLVHGRGPLLHLCPGESDSLKCCSTSIVSAVVSDWTLLALLLPLRCTAHGSLFLYNHEKMMQRNVFLLKRPHCAIPSVISLGLASGISREFED